jgi:hypothetical protein
MKEKLICVNNKVTNGLITRLGQSVPNLTLHKIYDGFISYPYRNLNTIKVVDDSGRLTTYKGDRFMKLSEYRQTKLNELGI